MKLVNQVVCDSIKSSIDTFDLSSINKFEYLFGEDQGRYVIEVDISNFKSITAILNQNSVHYDELGTVTDDNLIIDDKSKVSIDDLIKSHTTWLTNYMSK